MGNARVFSSNKTRENKKGDKKESQGRFFFVLSDDRCWIARIRLELFYEGYDDIFWEIFAFFWSAHDGKYECGTDIIFVYSIHKHIEMDMLYNGRGAEWYDDDFSRQSIWSGRCIFPSSFRERT